MGGWGRVGARTETDPTVSAASQKHWQLDQSVPPSTGSGFLLTKFLRSGITALPGRTSVGVPENRMLTHAHTHTHSRALCLLVTLTAKSYVANFQLN